MARHWSFQGFHPARFHGSTGHVENTNNLWDSRACGKVDVADSISSAIFNWAVQLFCYEIWFCSL